jgi:hypothetical protein
MHTAEARCCDGGLWKRSMMMKYQLSIESFENVDNDLVATQILDQSATDATHRNDVEQSTEKESFRICKVCEC